MLLNQSPQFIQSQNTPGRPYENQLTNNAANRAIRLLKTGIDSAITTANSQPVKVMASQENVPSLVLRTMCFVLLKNLAKTYDEAT